jgi:hypothetical protein
MSSSTRRRIVPVSLGVAMLAVVIAAALVPNAGAVPATSNCPYSPCSTSPATVPAWEIASIGAIVVLGLLIGLFLVMRRRRRPPAEGVVVAAAPGGGPPAGAMEPAPTAPSPEEISSAAYVETPEDVGTPPPPLGTPPAAAGAGAAASAESEPDIDSLMAELDKISGEILKRTPKKGSQTSAEEDIDETPSP